MAVNGLAIANWKRLNGCHAHRKREEVLKTTALLRKVATLDAMALLLEDVLRIACRGGAEAFGQPNIIGSLEVGKKADVVLVD